MAEKRKPGKYFLPGLTIILLLLTIEFYLPTLITEQLTRAINVYFYHTREIEVQQKTRPASLLLWGQIKNLSIKGSELEAKQFTINRFLMETDKIHIAILDLIINGRFNILKGKGRVALSLSEKELDRYLHRFIIEDPYNDIRLFLTKDGPSIQGLFAGEQFYLDCVFTVEKNSVICLNPQKMVATGSNNATVMNKLKELAGYSLDLGNLGIPLIIDEITVADGMLYVFATIDR